MEESKTSKGKEILTILLFTMVIATGTLAWIVWSSNDNTKMNVTIGELADVSFKTGSDINIGNLSPSFYYDDGALTEFSIRKKKGLTTTLNTSIYLDITSIDEELKNDSFKYVLLSSSDGNTYNEVTNGSFKDASVGKLSIVTDSPLAENKTYYKFYIWIDGNNENNETMQGRSMKASLNVEVERPPINAVTLVESLDVGSIGDDGSGVYKVSHDTIASDISATGREIKASDDYRYYGANPKNYICLDKEGQSTCPDRGLYRIIGSIYEEKAGKNLIKAIKATPITDGTTSGFSWDYKSDDSYTNNWSTSTLMTLLNSGAWWKGESGSYYNGRTTATTINFTNKGLTDTAREMVNDSLYYLGGAVDNKIKSSDIYIYERGTTAYDGHELSWVGKVGLMYPSDFGYAAGMTCATSTNLRDYGDSCKSKDWLFSKGLGKWTMTPVSVVSRMGFCIIFDEVVNYFTPGGVIGSALSVYPVFYLTSTTSIIDGDGSFNNPYILK